MESSSDDSEFDYEDFDQLMASVTDEDRKRAFVQDIIMYRSFRRSEYNWSFTEDETIPEIIECILGRFVYIKSTPEMIKYISDQVENRWELWNIDNYVLEEIGLDDKQIDIFRSIASRLYDQHELEKEDLNTLTEIYEREKNIYFKWIEKQNNDNQYKK